MEYRELAVKVFNEMHAHFKSKPFKQIHEALHGGGFILQYIALQGGSVLPGDISSEMDISSARVAAVLNNLESKGLVTRQIDKTDRRKIIVSITPEGKEYAERQYSHIIDGLSKLLELLGERDAKDGLRILSRLAELTPELWGKLEFVKTMKSECKE